MVGGYFNLGKSWHLSALLHGYFLCRWLLLCGKASRITEDTDMNMPIAPAIELQPSRKILRMKQLIELTALSRSTLYDMMDVKSKRYDPSFPRVIKLTEATVGWLESEVNAWIDNKIKQSRGL